MKHKHQPLNNKLQKTNSCPIIGLSPMDGVTDAAFRFIADKYGKPDLLITEFTSTEGVARGIDILLHAFIYHKTDTMTIAQVFGSDPESFYKTAFVICEMGFDGIDINMGCPDRSIAKKGGGAALIKTPELAKSLIDITKQAVKDWSNGKKIEDSGLPKNIVNWVNEFKIKNSVSSKRKIIPVSVKTRIGYDKVVTKIWLTQLLETNLYAITVHGRTLTQMYTGSANWEEIGIAAEIARGSDTRIYGNGDIKNIEEANKKIDDYFLDGVLIGRSSFGNPWIFKEENPQLEERLKVTLEHCQKFTEMTPSLNFLSLRKHLAWYCKGFDRAAHIRDRLMRVNNLQDVEKILHSIPS